MNPVETTLRDRFLRHVCQTSPDPLGIEVVSAEGPWVRDRAGRQYLDLLSGIGVATIGHRHPEVVRAVHEQANRYLHVTVYGEGILEPQVRLAEEIARMCPDDLSVVYFTNSGAEAVEGALKVARKYTRRRTFVCFDGAFHGDTWMAMSVGGNPHYQRPFEPLFSEVRRLPWNDVSALDAIDHGTAAVIVEPVQAEAGVRIPDPDFLPALRGRCSQTGALLIADEVLTGLGRTGRWLACEHWGVVPDLVVLAKALGGGLPLGAFVGRPESMATLSDDPPLAHVTTFGGHPVSCAAGLAALAVARRVDLPQAARSAGEIWLRGLGDLQARGGALRAVRGLGCLLALEFADAVVTRRFCRAALERGLILNWTLHSDTVVRLAPPVLMSRQEIGVALERIEAALRAAT